MCLLQTFCITTKCVNLVQQKTRPLDNAVTVQKHVDIYKESPYLIFKGSQISFQTLVFAKESLNTGQVTTKVIGGH